MLGISIDLTIKHWGKSIDWFSNAIYLNELFWFLFIWNHFCQTLKEPA
jgi:hypothetical protein